MALTTGVCVFAFFVLGSLLAAAPPARATPTTVSVSAYSTPTLFAYNGQPIVLTAGLLIQGNPGTVKAGQVTGIAAADALGTVFVCGAPACGTGLCRATCTGTLVVNASSAQNAIADAVTVSALVQTTRVFGTQSLSVERTPLQFSASAATFGSAGATVPFAFALGSPGGNWTLSINAATSTGDVVTLASCAPAYVNPLFVNGCAFPLGVTGACADVSPWNNVTCVGTLVTSSQDVAAGQVSVQVDVSLVDWEYTESGALVVVTVGGSQVALINADYTDAHAFVVLYAP